MNCFLPSGPMDEFELGNNVAQVGNGVHKKRVLRPVVKYCSRPMVKCKAYGTDKRAISGFAGGSGGFGEGSYDRLVWW